MDDEVPMSSVYKNSDKIENQGNPIVNTTQVIITVCLCFHICISPIVPF